MIIDLHCHAYPARAADAVNARLARHGLAVPEIPTFYPDEYLRIMDRLGIELAVLSLPGPNPDALATPAARLDFARHLNDTYATAVRLHPDRFDAFGRVPLVDGDAAATELRRLVVDLGLAGVVLPTNVLDRPLDDPAFDPFWAEADRLQSICFLHPLDSDCGARYGAHDLLTRIGWPADTTLAVGRLVLSGHRDRFPNPPLVLSHLGGLIPTYLSRLSWATGEPACTRPPEDYYRSFYYDTAGEVRAPSIRAAAELLGADRIVYGSDYPFGQASYPGHLLAARVPPEAVYDVTLGELAAVDLPPADLDLIRFGNARRLLARPNS